MTTGLNSKKTTSNKTSTIKGAARRFFMRSMESSMAIIHCPKCAKSISDMNNMLLFMRNDGKLEFLSVVKIRLKINSKLC